TGLVGRLAGGLLGLPVIGSAGFNLLASAASIRYYLQRVYADPTLVDEPLVGQHWATSHQPDARLAPSAFIAGRLDLPFSQDPAPIGAPILVLRGAAGGIGRITSDDELLQLGPRVTIRTIDGAGQLPHDDAPDRVI